MLPPDLIQETNESDNTLNHDINEALTKTEQQQEETMKQRRAREELLYDNLEETAPIPVSCLQQTSHLLPPLQIPRLLYFLLPMQRL